MKQKLIFLLLGLPFILSSQVTITPSIFDVNQSITITVDTNSTATDCNGFSSPAKVYIHTGVGPESNPWTYVIGNWGQDDGVGEMTDNGDGTWSITFTPEAYYGLTTEQASTITKMGMVFRNEDGSQEFKDNGCTDFFFNVGSFQLTLTLPTQSLTTLISGQTLAIAATTSLSADFVLKANGTTINTSSNTTSYSFNHVVTENTNYSLEATNDGNTLSKAFQAIVSITEETVPAGMKDGINLDTNDNSKATLVLYAPNKDVVHLIGDFNNWQVDNTYLLKKDSPNNRFWIELTGLTPQTNHMYQYLVDGDIVIADPYSTTILDEFNDGFINSTTYPNLPAYPTGQTNHAVTLLRTGDTPYNWQTTNFQPPAKTDLVIYELLIRDFDALHSFDAVKDRLDYLQSLGINAIEFMPVSEFDGNESWGYNPSFHMALDKYYGTPTAFKQFIDECHNRGIAVILDVVYNHASGQNPFYRMWNTDNGGYGGQASNDSPFFNPVATHSYSVFNDFNHSQQATKDYVKRTTQYWIEEYKIDGFRWDLTKGFTQNCTGSETCTNAFQADRVAVLKEYADYQWAMDTDFYVIFEHLGGNTEETEWVNYRLGEGKGIMVWGNHNFNYNEATMGFHDSGKSDFSWISYLNRGWTVPANISYMESHDEERLMYKKLQFGNSSGGYNIQTLSTALDRMELAGAFYFTVPGPKMIWQFGELGYDISIDDPCRVCNKPIRWDYFTEPDRKAIYDLWSVLINLKLNEPIFKTSAFSLDVGNSNGLKTIHLTLASAAAEEIKYVTIIGNFGVTSQNITPNFQETGVWYEFLNGNLEYVVNNTSDPISLQPGEFRIFGNNPTSLLPNNNIEDEDNDGVADADDLCPNTALNTTVDVDGCEVFTLPANNFALQINSETCRSSNNGSISITAVENLNYTITIIGDGVNITEAFTTDYTANNLEAGDYSACITVEGQSGYEQCFNVTITEPEDLAVFSRVNNSTGKVSLDLSGSSSYKIKLNGKLIETSNSEIELSLNIGENILNVEGEKICQGIYEETIYYSPKMIVFPNPINKDVLSINLGSGETSQVQISLYTILGKLVYSKIMIPQNNLIRLDFYAFAKGMYVLNVVTDKESKSFKLIKQ
ncbi:MAG: T9SS type A sorting domain-containing protein [Flavobacteriaceae bacterium]|nr:T9SS type A sorting domain-containing protein [Flavobacteriaceae bacterium]